MESLLGSIFVRANRCGAGTCSYGFAPEPGGAISDGLSVANESCLRLERRRAQDDAFRGLPLKLADKLAWRRFWKQPS
jgi:hypothetical protein